MFEVEREEQKKDGGLGLTFPDRNFMERLR
jgi:hypothetical protein